MANTRADLCEQSMLFELARSWMKQVGELESDPDLRDAVKDVRTFARRRPTDQGGAEAATAAA
jgi:hypothetical protein